MFSNIHRSGVLTVLARLVPHETAAILAHSVHIIQPCPMSLHAKPHMSCACTFTHHLHFLQNNRGLLCAAVVTQYPLSDPTFSHWPTPLHIPGNTTTYKGTSALMKCMYYIYIYIYIQEQEINLQR